MPKSKSIVVAPAANSRSATLLSLPQFPRHVARDSNETPGRINCHPLLSQMRPLLDLEGIKHIKPPSLPSPMAWSSSSLKLFRKCKRKFYWRYIARLRPRYKAGALLVGIAFHEALGSWYKSPSAPMLRIAERICSAAEAEALVAADYYGEDEWDKLSTTLRTLRGMLAGYTQVYGDERRAWRYDRRHVEVPFNIEVDPGRVNFVGKIDLVANVPLRSMPKKRRIMVVEHKTASRIGESYADRLPLDTQCRGYIYGCAKGLNLWPSEVLYDVVRKCQLRKKKDESTEDFNERIALDYASRPSHYFYREDLMFDRGDIRAFEFELIQAQAELEAIYGAPGALDPRAWMPNDATCNEYFTNCPYLQLCQIGLDRGTAMHFTQSDRSNASELVDELTAANPDE